jgi:osmoprotectant transport system permease protein
MTRVLACLMCVLALVACSRPADEVRVGSKAFNEGVILGELLAQLAGPDAVHRAGMGGTGVLWAALTEGEIDAYVEYTGTLMQEIYATEAPADEAALLRLLERDGILMGPALGFNNTYAIGMPENLAEELGIRAISDLAAHPQLRLGFSNEFVDRTDGWPGLRDAYGLPQTAVTGMEHTLAYEALRAGRIEVTDLYSTDAEIEQYNLRTLTDDRGFFATYHAVILYRAELETRAPAAVAAWHRLEGRVTEDLMVGMNAAVKIDQRSERGTAERFLRDTLPALEAGEAAPVTTLREAGRRTMQDRLHDSLRRLPRLTWQHLLMVLVSLAAGTLVALPLGVIAHRYARAGQVILGAAGVLQTIPSIALLVLLIPLVGIGWWPAVIALFLYSLLPIVRNTHAGLSDIDPRLIDSAVALGLPAGKRLRLIELPLSLRSILAGIKTAAVINVGTATLGGFIGAGGYGEAILSGIRRQDNVQILEGAIPAAVMALLLQFAFDLLERRLTRNRD